DRAAARPRQHRVEDRRGGRTGSHRRGAGAAPVELGLLLGRPRDHRPALGGHPPWTQHAAPAGARQRGVLGRRRSRRAARPLAAHLAARGQAAGRSQRRSCVHRRPAGGSGVAAAALCRCRHGHHALQHHRRLPAGAVGAARPDRGSGRVPRPPRARARQLLGDRGRARGRGPGQRSRCRPGLPGLGRSARPPAALAPDGRSRRRRLRLRKGAAGPRGRRPRACRARGCSRIRHRCRDRACTRPPHRSGQAGGPTPPASDGMARPIWTGNLSFGLLNVPVSLMSGARSNDLSFRMLDARDRKPIRFERVNADTGEEVPWKEIVKAFEYDKGSYVVIDKADIAAASPETHESVEIEAFVDAEAIDIRYFEKPYVLVPGKKAEKGYVLLRETLRKSGKLGVARVVIRTREYLSAVMPLGDALVLMLMRYPQELVDPSEYKIPEGKAGDFRISAKELEMATQLVDSMAAKWNPDDYHDEFRERLADI